jgi:hypothetical protein
MKVQRGCIYKGEKKRRHKYSAYITPNGDVKTRKVD